MSVMSLKYLVCMFSVGIWCDDKWQFGHFCLWIVMWWICYAIFPSACYFFIICLPSAMAPRPTSPPSATAAPPATAIPIMPSFSSLFVTMASNSWEDEHWLNSFIALNWSQNSRQQNAIIFNYSSSPVLVDCPARPGAALVCTWARWRTPSAWCSRWRGSTGSLACSSRHDSADA